MSLFQEMEYFHGAIDHNECKLLLQETGDFLIRHQMANFDDLESDKVAYVLTLAVKSRISVVSEDENKETGPKRIKSVAICQENNMYFLSGSSESFPSIKELIDEYIASRKNVTANVPLSRGIGRQSWEMLLSDLAFSNPEQELGKGTFGSVVKGSLLRKNAVPIDVAVKKIQNGVNESVFVEIMQEARIMRALDHINIIKFHGVIVEGHPIMLIMEFMDGNSLAKMLRNKLIPKDFRLSIVFALLYGLNHVHEMGYIHRDVAARNVLISNNCKEVKLCDFGLSRKGKHYNMRNRQKIPVKWLSPEVIHYGAFSPKSDAWALGITIWEIYNDGSEPYPKKKNAEVKSMLADSISTVNNVLKLDGCSSEEKPPYDLCLAVGCLFSYEPAARPTLNDLAHACELAILPNLTGQIAENCKYHADRRPAFLADNAQKISDMKKVMEVRSKTMRRKTRSKSVMTPKETSKEGGTSGGGGGVKKSTRRNKESNVSINDSPKSSPISFRRSWLTLKSPVLKSSRKSKKKMNRKLL